MHRIKLPSMLNLICWLISSCLYAPNIQLTFWISTSLFAAFALRGNFVLGRFNELLHWSALELRSCCLMIVIAFQTNTRCPQPKLCWNGIGERQIFQRHMTYCPVLGQISLDFWDWRTFHCFLNLDILLRQANPCFLTKKIANPFMIPLPPCQNVRETSSLEIKFLNKGDTAKVLSYNSNRLWDCNNLISISFCNKIVSKWEERFCWIEGLASYACQHTSQKLISKQLT